MWFDEGLDACTWIGGGIIFAATSCMTLRERKAGAAPRPPSMF